MKIGIIAMGDLIQKAWIRRLSETVAAVGLTMSFSVTPSLAATACEDLARTTLLNATVTGAQVVQAGAFLPPAGRGSITTYANLPAFCRVTATLTPSSDSDIKIEIWLPVSGWNGKFQAVGNGGWA
jgi:hypothetical protein